MHIILMLVLVISGCALGSNVTWLFGGPVVIVGLLCFNMGTPAWREDQEGIFFFVGLVCCGALIVGNILGL